jgi:F0F1-type ATP synthase assembly protein I
MQQTVLGGAYRKVLILQAVGAMIFALVVLLFAGLQPAISVLLGGLVMMTGNLAYAFVARPSRLTAKAGTAVLFTHVLAQLAKLFLVLVLMLVALSSGQLAAGWFIAGIACALVGHWLSLVIHR